MKMLLTKLIKIQKRLRKNLILEDVLPEGIKTIAGVDQSFLDERGIISAIIVCKYPSMDVIEKTHTVTETNFPYIPGFLSFREGPAIIKSFLSLKKPPDVLIVDGNGILHPRGLGIASHVGLVLNSVTIGVAKKLLCGEFIEPKRVGDYSPIVYKNRTVGYSYKSKKHCRPIFISPGHKISLLTSLRLVKDCIEKYKLPTPLMLAHLYSKELRRNYIGENRKLKINHKLMNGHGSLEEH